MGAVEFQKPVEDSVDKVNDEIAVGEDLVFQRRWWNFERIVWSIFLLIILCDVAGVFGRGPLAHAHMQNAAIRMKYERIARFGTPSTVEITFEPSGLQPDGKFHLFASESLVDELGTQRVIPAPETTSIGSGGLSYTFPATPGKATAQFALQPSKPGLFDFAVQAPGAPALHARVFVMP
jgi:hypothetical protein